MDAQSNISRNIIKQQWAIEICLYSKHQKVCLQEAGFLPVQVTKVTIFLLHYSHSHPSKENPHASLCLQKNTLKPTHITSLVVFKQKKTMPHHHGPKFPSNLSTAAWTLPWVARNALIFSWVSKKPISWSCDSWVA